jgi:hypothetical protein
MKMRTFMMLVAQRINDYLRISSYLFPTAEESVSPSYDCTSGKFVWPSDGRKEYHLHLLPTANVGLFLHIMANTCILKYLHSMKGGQRL